MSSPDLLLILILTKLDNTKLDNIDTKPDAEFIDDINDDNMDGYPSILPHCGRSYLLQFLSITINQLLLNSLTVPHSHFHYACLRKQA